MANIVGSGFMRWDTVAGAAFDGTNGPRKPKVKEIRIECGAVGGVTTLQVDGKDFFSFNVPSDSIINLVYAAGQYMPGLAMTAKGTNVVATVVYE